MTFVILKNYASAPIRKGRLSLTSKATREASQNKFVEKDRMPYKAKRFGEVDSSENRQKSRPGFVKPIRNGPKKKQNSIKCRPSRAKTGLLRRENEVRLQKERKVGKISLQGVRSTFRVPKGLTLIKVPGIKRFLEEGKTEEELVLLFVEEEQL